MRTGPVERFDLEREKLLNPTLAVDGETRRQFRRFLCGEDLHPRQEFEPRLVRVVHQKQRRPIIGFEVAGRDILLVAAIVGEAERGRAQHL